jgi:hypothetical protein
VLIVKTPKHLKEHSAEVLKTRDEAKILKALYNLFLTFRKHFHQKMKPRYIIFIATTFIINATFWYYIIAFCAVYIKTSVGWIYACLINIIFSWFFLQFANPVTGALVRSFVLKHNRFM